MNQIQRDWQMIKDSEWWHWLKGEIEQQKQSHIVYVAVFVLSQMF